jgi:hypothetical protein
MGSYVMQKPEACKIPSRKNHVLGTRMKGSRGGNKFFESWK